MNKVLIISTGGTFDKEYGAGAGVLNFTFGSPAASNILKRSGVYYGYSIVNPFSKDSLEMTDADRYLILTLCQKYVNEKIVITHGTDTMIDTARVLACASMEKTIVITGSSQPAVMRDTDADFNLGFALGVAQVGSIGVSIAMNGQVFEWDRVSKNLTTGLFERK